MKKTQLTAIEMELLEDTSEHNEWVKLRNKVHQADMKLLDAQANLDEFELDWAREVEDEVKKILRVLKA
jgi:hypothetical protein